MLSIFDSSAALGRRELLRIGSLALGGLSLADLLAGRAHSAATSARPVHDKSVVLLFMQGGPSQFETFDPKMTAPSGIHSVTGEIDTKIPGITFGSTFEKLAQMNDRFNIVRSFTTGDANHDIKPVMSKDTLKASLGAIYNRIAGTTHPTKGIPSSALLYPRSVLADGKAPPLGFGNHGDPGQLGAAYAPFVPGAGPLNDNMKLTLPRERMYDRQTLLGQLDDIRRTIDTQGQLTGMDKFQEQAFTTILGNVAAAFDLSKEDPAVVARYDTGPLVTPSQISRKWNNYNNYVNHTQSLGKLMLLARRLCESGVGFVTISTDFVWDNHADSNNAGVEEGMQYCGKPFDHAVSTFLTDVRERGLSDKIMLVCCGEMGRTPRVNARGGRDHWGNLAPLLISGGGIPSGKVIGQSTRDGGEPLTDAVTNRHLIGTIMNSVFDMSQLRLLRNLPSDLLRTLTELPTIPGLG